MQPKNHQNQTSILGLHISFPEGTPRNNPSDLLEKMRMEKIPKHILPNGGEYLMLMNPTVESVKNHLNKTKNQILPNPYPSMYGIFHIYLHLA